MNVLGQYLERYAEPEAREKPPVGTQWDCAVVIPVLAESELIESTLYSLNTAAGARRVLAILVVNARDDHDPSIHEDNARLLKQLPQTHWNSLDQILIDRTSPSRRLPPGQGVGLARKIGGDVAVNLFRQGLLKSPYIFMTDGDSRVDSDYFDLPQDVGKLHYTGLGSFPAVFVHPFTHECGGEALSSLETSALRQYDCFLRYYEAGLRYAGSPYAFAALGSTLCFHAQSYAEVRGFPKREAGEDFYFLSKMAQVGRVYFRHDGRVTLHDRRSARVPFGTGAALRKISGELAQGHEYRVLHPETFEQLKEVLHRLEYPPERWLAHFIDDKVRGVLVQMGVPAALEKAWKTRPQPADRLRHLHTWFDALRTLKFLHGLRDAGYESVPVSDPRVSMRTSAHGGACT